MGDDDEWEDEDALTEAEAATLQAIRARKKKLVAGERRGGGGWVGVMGGWVSEWGRVGRGAAYACVCVDA